MSKTYTENSNGNERNNGPLPTEPHFQIESGKGSDKLNRKVIVNPQGGYLVTSPTTNPNPPKNRDRQRSSP